MYLYFQLHCRKNISFSLASVPAPRIEMNEWMNGWLAGWVYCNMSSEYSAYSDHSPFLCAVRLEKVKCDNQADEICICNAGFYLVSTFSNK